MGRTDTRALGRDAETLALAHLRKHGLRLIARNFVCRLGEIDLVMTDARCLVFAEVRHRRAGNPVSALQSIDPAKKRRIATAAAVFLRRHRQYGDCVMRFDVIAIDGPLCESAAIQWIRDAFRPDF